MRPQDHAEHVPQLDSLRALAVGAVMVSHFAPHAALGPLANIGVRLFFVLSGFLITGILLRCRALAAEGTPVSALVCRFYARRFLRIFPLFYGALAVSWLAGVPEVRDSLPWHLTYTSNLYLTRLGQWHGPVSHFWSLAVEEQFYLIWPAAILCVPAARLQPLLLIVAASAPAYRAIGVWQDWPPIAVQTLPFGCLDSLALGALLASARSGDPILRRRLTAMAAWVAPLLIATWALAAFDVPVAARWRTALDDTLWSLVFVWMIDRAATGFGGRIGAILDARPLVYLGTISYGLYVIHNFMPPFVAWCWQSVGFAAAYPPNALVGVAAPASMTVGLAALSWHAYEGPINRLKRYVPYHGTSTLLDRLSRLTAPMRTRLRQIPIVSLSLCAIACVVFAGINLHRPNLTQDTLTAWGDPPADRIWDGAYWGLVSSAFVHVELLHLAFNVYWLWKLGAAAERALGPLKYLVFVIVAAAVSSSFQLAVSGATGIGASGVGYAIFGLMWASRSLVPAFAAALDDRTEKLFWAWLIGCLVATWLGLMQVGNAAHVTGLLFGCVAARWLIPSSTSTAEQALAPAGVAVLVALAAVPLLWNPWSAPWVAYKGYKAHVAGDYDAAIAAYRRSIALGGDRLWALENIAFAYHAKHQDDEVAAILDEIRARDARAAAAIEMELRQVSQKDRSRSR
jgi:peptidoglycan/LPS O-acetylase OafA/YrhL